MSAWVLILAWCVQIGPAAGACQSRVLPGAADDHAVCKAMGAFLLEQQAAEVERLGGSIIMRSADCVRVGGAVG